MSVEFKYFGFFETSSNEEIDDLLRVESDNEELLSSYTKFSSDDGKLYFSFTGDDSYDSWIKVFPTIQEFIGDTSEFIIITFCDHDEDGSQVDGKLQNNDLKGLIPFNDYFDLLESVDYDLFKLSKVVEAQLRSKELQLAEIPVYEEI